MLEDKTEIDKSLFNSDEAGDATGTAIQPAATAMTTPRDTCQHQGMHHDHAMRVWHLLLKLACLRLLPATLFHRAAAESCRYRSRIKATHGDRQLKWAKDATKSARIGC